MARHLEMEEMWFRACQGLRPFNSFARWFAASEGVAAPRLDRVYICRLVRDLKEILMSPSISVWEIVSEMGVERHALPRLLSYFGCVRLVMNSRLAG